MPKESVKGQDRIAGEKSHVLWIHPLLEELCGILRWIVLYLYKAQGASIYLSL